MKVLLITIVCMMGLGNKTAEMIQQRERAEQIAIHKELAEQAYNDYQEELKARKEAQQNSQPTVEIAEDGYVGVYQLTAYEYTNNPCADGQMPQTGYTVACNDRRLWHKWVYIEGYGTYYVHDTGGMANNVIDIYLGDYDECIQFGRQSANVYIVGD